MVPYFTSRIVANYVIVRPYAPLWIMVGASLAHGLLEGLGLGRWTWLADLPLAECPQIAIHSAQEEQEAFSQLAAGSEGTIVIAPERHTSRSACSAFVSLSR